MWFVVLLLVSIESPVISVETIADGPMRQLVFTEDLRFGGEASNDEASYWSGLYPKVVAGPDGRIYVADTGANRVLCYDREGQFLEEVSGQGHGPGEFQMLTYFTVLTDGTAIAFDAPNDTGRFLYFDRELNYLDQVSPGLGAVRRAFVSPNGKRMWVNHLGPYGEAFDVSFGVMNADLEFVVNLVQAPMTPFDRQRMNDPNYLRQRFGKIMALEMGRRGLAGFGLNGEVVTGISDTYELTQWESGMTAVKRIIRKQYKPRMRNQAQIDAIIDDYLERFKANIPPLRDAISRKLVEDAFAVSGLKPFWDPLLAILITPNGHIIAVTQTLDDGIQVADVYSEKGLLVGRAQVPNRGFVDAEYGPNMVFRGQFAYTMETVDGDFQVVRYTYQLH